MKNRPRMSNRHPRDFKRAVKVWPLHPRALVEGDSWMRYDSVFPLSLFGGSANLFKSVQHLTPMVSLSMSGNGDTLFRMLNDEGLGSIRERLSMTPFTFMFFSGGGNDIVNSLRELVWLRDHENNPETAADALKLYSVESMLYAMRDRLDALIRLRDAVSPGTRIIVSNYGVPNLRAGGFKRLGITLAGPWIRPKLKTMGYSLGWSHLLMRELMFRYDRMLRSLWPAIEIADTAKVLQPHHWRDEMHLTPHGYDVAAQVVYRML